MGKFGEVFTLAIWQSTRKSPNLILPILNPAAPAGWLTQVLGTVLVDTCIPPRYRGNSSFSPDRKFMSLTRIWGMLGEQTGPTSSEAVSPQNRVKYYNKYTLEERVKMGWYGAKNSPSKLTKCFSLLLDGKLTCSLCCCGYVIFG